MDVISEIFDMIGDILELVITQFIKGKEAKENKQDNKNERSKEKQCTIK